MFMPFHQKIMNFMEQKYISSLVSSQLNGFKIAFISDVNLTDQDSITRFEKLLMN